MKPWDLNGDRAACTAHYGNMSSLAGLKRYVLSDGKAAGVEAVDVKTGSGLEFTVLPGRGMDVAWTSWRGMPVAYLSKAGITAPGYHDPREMQWLKSFFAGLITTCGMSNAGPPCRDSHPILESVPYGLHGDVSNTGADNVCLREEWVEGEYRLAVSGRVREGRLHGELLELRREITATLGGKAIHIRDVYSNQGDQVTPLLFFYHINLGYPVLEEGSRFLAPSLEIEPGNPAARAGLVDYHRCTAPQRGYLEQQFFHTLAGDSRGNTLVALVNRERELGVALEFNVGQMPCFAQWKLCRQGEYVHAFEPGICRPIGRAEQRKQGLFQLAPMEEYQVEYAIRIVEGANELAALEDTINTLKKEETL